VITSYCADNMLQVFRTHGSKLYSRFCSTLPSELSRRAQLLCTDSDAAAQRVTSLRRRRSLRCGSARSAAAEPEFSMSPAETVIDGAEPVHSSRMQRIKQRQFVASDISVDTLKHHLDDAVSIPEPDTELEFPSDISTERKPQAFSRRDQARDAFRPNINPMDTSIILFPGQSSQFVGMGAKLLAYPTVEKMYKTASNILGYNLLDMCLHGPKDVLSKTVHCQPAVLVTSLAAVEKLKEVCPKVRSACTGDGRLFKVGWQEWGYMGRAPPWGSPDEGLGLCSQKLTKLVKICYFFQVLRLTLQYLHSLPCLQVFDMKRKKNQF